MAGNGYQKPRVEDCESEADALDNPALSPHLQPIPRPATGSSPKKPATRARSNNSDSGYSSRTGATLASTDSSRASSNKRLELHVDTRTSSQPVTSEARKKQSSSSVSTIKPSPSNPSTQQQAAPNKSERTKSRPLNGLGCTDPSCGGRCYAQQQYHQHSAAPMSNPAWQHMQNYPMPAVVQQPGFALPSPSPSVQTSQPSYNFPVRPPQARPRPVSITTQPRPVSYSSHSPYGYYEVPDSVSDYGPPLSSSAYSNSRLQPRSSQLQRASCPRELAYTPYAEHMNPSDYQQRPVGSRRMVRRARPASTMASGSNALSESVLPDDICYHQPRVSSRRRPVSVYQPDDTMFDYEEDAPQQHPLPTRAITTQALPTRSSSRRYSWYDATQPEPPRPPSIQSDYFDQTVRIPRRESSRPGILKSVSYHPPTEEEMSDHFSTLAVRGVSRAEKPCLLMHDAETYMSERNHGHGKTAGQPLTRTALEGKSRPDPSAVSSKTAQAGRSGTATASQHNRRGSVDSAAQSHASTRTSDSSKVKIQFPEGVNVELTGGTDGHTISYVPSDSGQDSHNIVIGNSASASGREKQYRGSSKSGGRSSDPFGRVKSCSSTKVSEGGRRRY